MTAEVTIGCPDGCFTVTYSGGIDDPDVDDRDFVNKLGVPQAIAVDPGNATCPNCEAGLDVDWKGIVDDD